jgi:triosephosphate isomerase
VNNARKPILVGNWKLHHSKKSAGLFFDEIMRALEHKNIAADLALAPVATMLDFAQQKLQNSCIRVSAQNVFYEAQGPYTGEWSSEDLHEMGVSYCIVGHSERRRLFHESNVDTGKKAKACVRAQVTPICCVGESLQERDDGDMLRVLERQLKAYAEYLAEHAYERDIILAYEPVWAIGTGRSATAMQAQEAHAHLRRLWGEYLGPDVAKRTRIIYGGSVTAQNIKEILASPDVDGALVGGASLQVESFLAMVVQLL